MIYKEKLRECWSDAISDCEDRLRGSLPVYKNFEDWYKDNIASDADLADVSDFAKRLLKKGDDLYERAKQARSQREEEMYAVESMAYKRIGKELMSHCR